MADELIMLSNGETLEVINENNVNGERTYKGELSFLKQIMNFYEDIFREKYVPIEKMSGFKILDEGGFVFNGRGNAKRSNILSGAQFQLKSEEIAKKIPNGDIMFINGKEEKNIKKSKNTNEHLHSQTNEHLHKKR